MSLVSPFINSASSPFGTTFGNLPPYVPNAPFGSPNDYFGLNRGAAQYQAIQQPVQQYGWQNYNNLIGTGLSAALGGAPTGPIQHLSNRMAAELYGGGDINGALLLPNTNLQPWHQIYAGGIGSIFDPIHTATPTGIGSFGMLNNNTANAFTGSFNGGLGNPFANPFANPFSNSGFNGFNNPVSWPAMFQSQNYVNPLQLYMGHHVNPGFPGNIYPNGAILDYSAFLGLQVANQMYNPYVQPYFT